MSNEPSTLDVWVAKLHQKEFQPDKDRSALVLAKVPNSALALFTDERSFTLPKVPPEHVAIMRQVDMGEYIRNGVATTVNPGDFAIFYTNYHRNPPVDTLGFFNAQGEPLDNEAREIQTRLFD